MFELAFMRLALVASVATGAALGIVGVYLVIRRVVFFGLVLANAATLGAAAAQVAGWPPELLSLTASIAAATVLGRSARTSLLSAESLMGWSYAAASSATILVLSLTATGSTDTMHLLFGNVLAVPESHAIGLLLLAVGIGLVQVLLGRRFLLVTFDSEAATVAGVHTRAWTLALNLTIGVTAAAAVHEIGALPTFGLLALPAMTALAVTGSVQATFVVATVLGSTVPVVALALSFYLDLPVGPACVALLALTVGGAVFTAAARGAMRTSPRES
jgi:zinc transport system permease protein